MIKKLQEIFPSLILKSNRSESDDYLWYITPDNEVIGIKKNEITVQAEYLLATFLTPYHIRLPDPTEKEQYWMDLIKTEEPIIEQKVENPYRFIYFSFAEKQLDPIAFKEAINTIFTKQIPILWENEHSGMIVEEKAHPIDESISYEQIIDILMSDLYVKINFFVGPFLLELNDARSYYHVLVKIAEKSFVHSEKQVITYPEAIPYLVVDQVGPDLRTMIMDMILKEVANDEELLHTIETFIACNLNISVTAKELFMHRNSLQYRIDKFIEKTGIDIRNFYQAMTVHLALLSKSYTD